MSDGSRRSVNVLLYDATKPSYQHWIALPAEAQQEGLKALHSRRVALEAQRATEQERTGIIRPGWILIGKGRTMHCLIRRPPRGKTFG